MTDGDQRWARIEEIFHGATGLSGDGLAGYLNDTCHGDAALRREVEALLRHASESGDQFDSSLSAARERLAGDAAPDFTGWHAGPFRIVEKIADGGMGSVFLAVREDDAFEQLERYAAIDQSDHPFAAEARALLGDVELRAGNAAEAEGLFRAAIAIQASNYGDEAIEVIDNRLLMADAIGLQGRSGEAALLRERAEATREQVMSGWRAAHGDD